MSSQSIIHNSDEKIAIQVNNFLKSAGKKYLLKKRFDVGEGIYLSDMRKVLRLCRIFCEDSCAIECEEAVKLKEKINKILIFNIPEL